jgi:hypothetical protein
MASPRRPPVEPAQRNSAIAPAMRGGLILLAAIAIGILLIWVDRDDAGPGGGLAAPTEETTTTTTLPTVVTTAAPTRDLKAVKLLIANGSKKQGAARRMQVILIPTYNVLEPTNTQNQTTPEAESKIFARGGFEDVVTDLNTRMGTNIAMIPLLEDSAAPVPAREAARADVILIVGLDLAEKFKNEATAAATPPA